jgi:hypothetical protein
VVFDCPLSLLQLSFLLRSTKINTNSLRFAMIDGRNLTVFCFPVNRQWQTFPENSVEYSMCIYIYICFLLSFSFQYILWTEFYDRAAFLVPISQLDNCTFNYCIMFPMACGRCCLLHKTRMITAISVVVMIFPVAITYHSKLYPTKKYHLKRNSISVTHYAAKVKSEAGLPPFNTLPTFPWSSSQIHPCR